MGYISKLINIVSEVNDINQHNLVRVNNLFNNVYGPEELILLQRAISSIPYYPISNNETIFNLLDSFYNVELIYDDVEKSLNINTLFSIRKFNHYEIAMLLISSVINDGFIIMEFEGEDETQWSVEIISNEIITYYDDYQNSIVKLI